MSREGGTGVAARIFGIKSQDIWESAALLMISLFLNRSALWNCDAKLQELFSK